MMSPRSLEKKKTPERIQRFLYPRLLTTRTMTKVFNNSARAGRTGGSCGAKGSAATQGTRLAARCRSPLSCPVSLGGRDGWMAAHIASAGLTAWSCLTSFRVEREVLVSQPHGKQRRLYLPTASRRQVRSLLLVARRSRSGGEEVGKLQPAAAEIVPPADKLPSVPSRRR